jgi:lipid-A-disaccharide synthase
MSAHANHDSAISSSAGASSSPSRDILIIAGEASGDRHAAALIEELRQLHPDLRFSGIGGTRMREQGAELLYDASQTSVVGFIEVLKRYPFLRSVFQHIIRHAEAIRPRFAILVDYPGFNLRLAGELHRLGIPVVYYIAPQVWAWKEKRVETLRRYVDDLIVVFPFEVQYFQQRGISASFFGHPLVEQLMKADTDVASVISTSQSEHPADARPKIAYLPGSRPEELRRHMPVISEVISQLGNSYRHVIPVAPTLDRAEIEKYQTDTRFELVGETTTALQGASAALVKSGTSTIETTLHSVPFAVMYKTSTLSYEIARRAIKVSSIAMVNLLAGKQVVREFVQTEATPENLAAELRQLLDDTVYRERMIEDLKEVTRQLGGRGAARRAAEYISDKYL